MNKLLLAALLFTGIAAHAQVQGSCNNANNYASTSLTATTQLITVPTTIARAAIHICAVTLQVSQSATPVSFGLTSGTGSTCATGNALVTPAYLGTASTSQVIAESYGGSALNVPAGANLCLTLSGAPTGAVVHIIYTVF